MLPGFTQSSPYVAIAWRGTGTSSVAAMMSSISGEGAATRTTTVRSSGALTPSISGVISPSRMRRAFSIL